MAGILAGLRLVEASAFVAAPLGGMTLAQLGADVIRIDPPGGGLDFHRWPVNAEDVSAFWNGLNKGKRSVCIDFTKPEGRELAEALVTAPGPDAGLLLTNFPPRGWLSYEALRAKRPDLIQLTIQGDRFGGSAVDYTVNCATGLPYLTGPARETNPVNHVLPAWDLVTGQMAAVGLLAAERARRSNGRGQHIKLALEDVALATMGNLGFIAEAQLGQDRPRMGNQLFGAFGLDFECADGPRVMVIALTLRQWQSLVAALALQTEIDSLQTRLDLDFSREGHRYHARAELARLVAEKIERRSFADVQAIFDQHGVCWGKYQTVRELVSTDESCSERNPLFKSIEQPGFGPTLTPTIPLEFADEGRLPPCAAPQLGAHTRDVLEEILRLSSRAVEELRERRVIMCSAQ